MKTEPSDWVLDRNARQQSWGMMGYTMGFYIQSTVTDEEAMIFFKERHVIADKLKVTTPGFRGEVARCLRKQRNRCRKNIS